MTQPARADHARGNTFSTFGRSDTVMVLFEDIDGDRITMKGDDDSGFDGNARLPDQGPQIQAPHPAL
ncbi:hypothetical protein [Roseibium sp.]|uniref:hypothetical protein n=1 Tax=Roseibium sp. TaxID=1936156 RepID=UPI003A96D000